MQKTIAFDFDGVIRSYKSGWKGVTVISDPPVEGIKEVIEELRRSGCRVVIYSTRSNTLDGMIAITDYLRENKIEVDEVVEYKSVAYCYVDDRAITFDGNCIGLVNKILSFKSYLD